MRHTKFVEVPAYQAVVFDYNSCDFCGVTIPHNEVMLYAEVTKERIVTKTSFDCCVVCWEQKILPALKALGNDPKIEQCRVYD